MLMKSSWKLCLPFLISVSLSATSHAVELSEVLDMSAVGSGGNGCVGGLATHQVDLSDRRGRLRVYLDTMTAVTGNGRALDRRACAISIPLSLPADKKLVVTRSDLISRLEVAANSTTVINTEVFLTGLTGLPVKREYEAITDFYGTVLDQNVEGMETACGAQGLLRLNSSVRVQSRDESAADVRRIGLNLHLEDCTPSGPVILQ